MLTLLKICDTKYRLSWEVQYMVEELTSCRFMPYNILYHYLSGPTWNSTGHLVFRELNYAYLS